MKKNEIEDKKDIPVLEYKKFVLDNIWGKWLIFKSNQTKDQHLELKKLLPPYFDTNINKLNDFSMRENVLFPPCPQEFLEVLLNGILLRNELNLYRSKYYFYRELQQLLSEFLKIFYYRIDAIIDIFQTISKLSLSKEKLPRISVKCSNCDLNVFIEIQCDKCQNEFYCDETCRKIHSEVHKSSCLKNLGKIPKIHDPLRIEVHISSDSLGEDIMIYSEHYMSYFKMMKGKVLLAFLFKSLRKDRWFRNNKYVLDEDIENDCIAIRRGINVEIDVVEYDNKDFLHKISIKNLENNFEDEFRDLLRLSVVQELKFSFYKLGALLIDILKETHLNQFKYVMVFNFP